ncbi:MAG: LptF/LptG family permease [Pseudomonadota bacterium]
MPTLDRYILRQILGPFCFFAVVFTALFWLNSALRVISFIVENGQSGGVFLTFSVLLLPQSFQSVVVVSAFAAALYLANALYNNSELVIMMTAGQSPTRTLVPFALFGLGCFALLMFLTNFVSPNTARILSDERAEMRSALAQQLAQEARFISPSDNVTVFFGTVDNDGGLGDVFIDDRSIPAQRQTYFSESGQFITTDGELRLLLLNGTTQVLSEDSEKLSTLKFESLSYNLSELQENYDDRQRSIREYQSHELLLGQTEFSPSKAWVEIHQRVALALFALLTPIFGAMALLVSGFRRQGYTLNLLAAIGVFIILETARGNIKRLINSDQLHSLTMYLPILAILGCIIALIFIASRNGQWRVK